MSARKPFALRLDPALYDALQRAADAEIEVLLREALARRGVKVPVNKGPKRGRPAGPAPAPRPRPAMMHDHPPGGRRRRDSAGSACSGHAKPGRLIA